MKTPHEPKEKGSENIDGQRTHAQSYNSRKTTTLPDGTRIVVTTTKVNGVVTKTTTNHPPPFPKKSRALKTMPDGFVQVINIPTVTHPSGRREPRKNVEFRSPNSSAFPHEDYIRVPTLCLKHENSDAPQGHQQHGNRTVPEITFHAPEESIMDNKDNSNMNSLGEAEGSPTNSRANTSIVTGKDPSDTTHAVKGLSGLEQINDATEPFPDIQQYEMSQMNNERNSIFFPEKLKKKTNSGCNGGMSPLTSIKIKQNNVRSSEPTIQGIEMLDDETEPLPMGFSTEPLELDLTCKKEIVNAPLGLESISEGDPPIPQANTFDLEFSKQKKKKNDMSCSIVSPEVSPQDENQVSSPRTERLVHDAQPQLSTLEENYRMAYIPNNQGHPDKSDDFIIASGYTIPDAILVESNNNDSETPVLESPPLSNSSCEYLHSSQSQQQKPSLEIDSPTANVLPLFENKNEEKCRPWIVIIIGFVTIVVVSVGTAMGIILGKDHDVATATLSSPTPVAQVTHSAEITTTTTTIHDATVAPTHDAYEVKNTPATPSIITTSTTSNSFTPTTTLPPKTKKPFFFCTDFAGNEELCIDAECVGDVRCKCGLYTREKERGEIMEYCNHCEVCSDRDDLFGGDCSNIGGVQMPCNIPTTSTMAPPLSIDYCFSNGGDLEACIQSICNLVSCPCTFFFRNKTNEDIIGTCDSCSICGGGEFGFAYNCSNLEEGLVQECQYH